MSFLGAASDQLGVLVDAPGAISGATHATRCIAGASNARNR